MIATDPDALLGEPPPLPADLESALRQMLARHRGTTAELKVALHVRGAEVACTFEEPHRVAARRGRFAWHLLVRD